MYYTEILEATRQLEQEVKKTWPRGWGRLVCDGEKFFGVVYDNKMLSTSFSAERPSEALQKATDFARQERPISEEQLASILGI